MSENLQQISMRIKELRNICGYSKESMAQELDISTEEYKAYESGQVDIPISVLCEIAAKLNVEVTALISGDQPKLHTYALTRKGKGLNVARRPEYIYESLASNFYQKRIEPFVVTVEPKAVHTPVSLNIHPGQEFDFVLDGTLAVVINNKELILEAGDSIYIDSSRPHGMKAIGDKPARFLAIVMS